MIQDYKLNKDSEGDTFFLSIKGSLASVTIEKLTVEKEKGETPKDSCDCEECIESGIFRIQATVESESRVAKSIAKERFSDSIRSDEYPIGFSRKGDAIAHSIKELQEENEISKRAIDRNDSLINSLITSLNQSLRE